MLTRQAVEQTMAVCGVHTPWACTEFPKPAHQGAILPFSCSHLHVLSAGSGSADPLSAQSMMG